MSRQIYQKSGLIAALIIASVSLPFGILGFTREPTATDNYYDENYYNYYNQTYYGLNETEPDYSKPLETTEYYNFSQHECFVRNFTLNSNYAYWFYFNKSTSFNLRLFVVRSIFYQNVLDLNGTAQLVLFLSNVKTYETSFGEDFKTFQYTPLFTSNWLFIYMTNDAIAGYNITLLDEIIHI